jgi:hypothetical protein
MFSLRRLVAFDLLLPILAALIIAIYLVQQLPAATHKAAVFATAAAYVAFIVWLSSQARELRLTLFICQAAVLLAVYGAEIYATHRKYESASLIGQAKRLTAAGSEAWPAIPPSTWYFGLYRADIDAGRMLLPLAGLSKVKSVLCVEGEGWVTFTADRSGFRNPPRPDGEENVDLLMIGDSFAEGSCVSDDGTMAGHLRRGGTSVLNLGMHGSGPMLELAILYEYAARPRFKRLVWMFFEGNDIFDLARESESAMLRRYLVDGAFQKLEGRQAEVDAALRAGLQGRDDRFSWPDVARLKELRAAFGIVGVGHGGDLRPPVTPHLPLLAEVWDRARRFTEEKGATFTILYVPAPTRFLKGSADATYFTAMEQSVSTLACRAGFDFVSLTRPLERTAKPIDSYTYLNGRHGHFTEAGYRLAADTLRRRLAGQDQPDCPAR